MGPWKAGRASGRGREGGLEEAAVGAEAEDPRHLALGQRQHRLAEEPPPPPNTTAGAWLGASPVVSARGQARCAGAGTWTRVLDAPPSLALFTCAAQTLRQLVWKGSVSERVGQDLTPPVSPPCTGGSLARKCPVFLSPRLKPLWLLED